MKYLNLEKHIATLMNKLSISIVTIFQLKKVATVKALLIIMNMLIQFKNMVFCVGAIFLMLVMSFNVK